ncbi:MAG TPA: methyltransferase domain-containing protein [Anaerolineae bacterium]|nr:methyltransferase domain-containing protein [Anaerolineae bacterium]
MTSTSSNSKTLEQSVRAMYSEHPFPNYISIPPSQSDERFRYIYEEFLQIPLDQLVNNTFLDAGCGTGENTWSWTRILDPSTHVVAVDQSWASVTIAQRHGSDRPRSPSFAVGSLLNLTLADNSVDVVFCSGVLVAVTDPDRAFRELVRVLRPGGYMILVLYHRYGRALHGFRRAIIDLIEREDIDRRAQLGGKLFGQSMRKLAAETHAPLEGVLYDQFGLPCESRYSVGQVLAWYRQANIRYLGTWPPIEWKQFGKALRFSSVFRRRRPWLHRFLLRLFRDTDCSPDRPPRFVTRATMQVLWALDQLQLFAISGRKEAHSGD